jgi:hypothetical protein
MCRSKFHLHKTNNQTVFDPMWTTPLHGFCCGMCGSQEFTSHICQKARRLVRKISGQHTWHFILRTDYFMSLKKKR